MNRWGRSSVVERKLCMFEAPGSIPGVSTFLIFISKLGFLRVSNTVVFIREKRNVKTLLICYVFSSISPHYQKKANYFWWLIGCFHL